MKETDLEARLDRAILALKNEVMSHFEPQKVRKVPPASSSKSEKSNQRGQKRLIENLRRWFRSRR